MCRSPIAAAILLGVVILGAYFHDVSGQADGNPHGWDRKRRCDHTDYDPPCGACEGIGGLATGDKNEQITLTTCEIVANKSGIDPSTLIQPVWGPHWVAENYNEILIGPKRDPFCFEVFPENTSNGELCYRHDSGTQYYDMTTSGMLREELKLDTKAGPVESVVQHQGKYFWVVNHFPWYALGVHQCICTMAKEGGAAGAKPVYPIQYNWTQQLFFVAREKIGIEYIDQKRVLDHWSFGPHHVWSDPKTGNAIRMWQPFNGLQVFPNGTGTTPVPASKFTDAPPALCKKEGGAAFRVKCTDDGYPQTPKEIAERRSSLKQKLISLSSAPMAVGEVDRKRAVERVPRPEYKGDTFQNMSDALNKWLVGSSAVKMCHQWDSAALQELLGELYLARHSDLDKIYQSVTDNRRLRGTIDEMKASWAKLNELISAHSDSKELAAIQRDGHCHQAVMWYVHHLSADAKKLLGESGVEIPLLAYDNHLPACESASADTVRNQVCEHYQETVTCFSCHSNVRPAMRI